MASTAIDENFKKRENDACTFAMEAGGQQYYRCARSWRRRKSARRSRIPSPPPPSSPSEETIYLKPSPWPRRLKIAVRSKPPEPEEEAAAEYSMPPASPATTRVSRCSGTWIPVSSVGDNFAPPSPSHYSPSPSSSSSSGSVTSPFYHDCLDCHVSVLGNYSSYFYC